MTIGTLEGDKLARGPRWGKVFLRMLLIVIVWSLVESMALGYCPEIPPRACSAFFQSDAVIVGMVVSEDAKVDAQGQVEGWSYMVKVDSVIRGPAGDKVSVFTENDSARLRLQLHTRYVLFCTIESGRLVISDDCSDLSSPDRLQSVIDELKRIEQLPDASVEGEVRRRSPSGMGVAGLRFVVEGDGVRFLGKTDKAGHFEVRVPSGSYSLHFQSKNVRPYEMNRIETANIVLVRGECAQLLFLEDSTEAR